MSCMIKARESFWYLINMVRGPGVVGTPGVGSGVWVGSASIIGELLAAILLVLTLLVAEL